MCEINKSNEEEGLVYILTNPGYKDNVIKVGKSSRPAKVRARELDGTSVPDEFEVFATINTKNYDQLEKIFHNILDLFDLRRRPGREFFNISPDTMLELFKVQAVLIEDAVIYKFDEEGNPHQVYPSITEEKEDKSSKKRSSPRPGFTFEMVGIKAGEIVRFDPTGELVEVYDDDKDTSKNSIKYKGQYYSLSGYASEFMPDNKRKPSDKDKKQSYQGPKYFSYKGVKLSVLRDGIEHGRTLEEMVQEAAKDNVNTSDTTQDNGEGD